MEANTDNKNKITLLNYQRPKLGVEIHNHKIVPSLKKNFFEPIARESEWEQEYYIIYNSYDLDEKDSE